MKKIKKILFIIVIFLIIPLLTTASTTGITENFKMTFDTISTGDTETFMMNVKETSDGNFIGIKYYLQGGKSIVKFTSSGTIIWEEDFDLDKSESSTTEYLSDVVETSNGLYIVSSMEEKIFIYDPDKGTYTATTSSQVGHPSGRSTFEFNNNYIVIGTRQKDSSESTHTIILQILDANGSETETKEITLDAYKNGKYCTTCYYGAYSDSETLYLLASDGDDIVLLEVDADLNVNKRVLSTTLSEDDLNEIRQGVYTQLAIDDSENIYFATTYGIYKIDKSNTLTHPVSGTAKSYDFTSIITIGDYIIAGGLYNGGTDPEALIVVYDTSFNEIEKLDIHNSLNIDPGNGLSIVKTLVTTSYGFMASGMLSGTPYAIEYKLPYNISTKTDGNGTINLSASLAYYKDNVSFTVTAADGYSLDTLKITDANGNTITYTEGYTFTMPASDVTIEATFVKNPETQDIAISIITILAILAIIVVIDNRNKLKWLNK